MPYVLPTPEPQRKWYNDYGELSGLTARLLLAALSGGASGVPSLGKQPTQPTTGNPGQIQFPGGQRTNTSPLEQAMIAQLGGVPTTQGQILPQGQGGLDYRPPTKFGIGPSVNNQYLNSLMARQQTAPPAAVNPAAQSIPNAQQIEDDALNGNEDAVAAYRYLKAKGLL